MNIYRFKVNSRRCEWEIAVGSAEFRGHAVGWRYNLDNLSDRQREAEHNRKLHQSFDEEFSERFRIRPRAAQCRDLRPLQPMNGGVAEDLLQAVEAVRLRGKLSGANDGAGQAQRRAY